MEIPFWLECRTVQEYTEHEIETVLDRLKTICGDYFEHVQNHLTRVYGYTEWGTMKPKQDIMRALVHIGNIDTLNVNMLVTNLTSLDFTNDYIRKIVSQLDFEWMRRIVSHPHAETYEDFVNLAKCLFARNPGVLFVLLRYMSKTEHEYVTLTIFLKHLNKYKTDRMLDPRYFASIFWLNFMNWCRKPQNMDSFDLHELSSSRWIMDFALLLIKVTG